MIKPGNQLPFDGGNVKRGCRNPLYDHVKYAGVLVVFKSQPALWPIHIHHKIAGGIGYHLIGEIIPNYRHALPGKPWNGRTGVAHRTYNGGFRNSRYLRYPNKVYDLYSVSEMLYHFTADITKDQTFSLRLYYPPAFTQSGLRQG